MNILRLAIFALCLASGFALAPATAAAQGTCRCNNGCHANPGQCVQGSGCEVGFAPFCGNRSGTCPMTGWVSCAGDCMCVRIPNFDAGTSTDASSSPDVVSVDAPPPADAQRPDVQPMDVPAVVDVTVPLDTPPPRDVQVPCPNGIIVDGICYDEGCQYDREIGLYCGTGRRCIADGDAGMTGICVPVCAGTTCETGSYCDPVQGCRTGRPVCATTMCPIGQFCDPVGGCTSDRCAAIDCPMQSTCTMNRCVSSVSPDAGRNDGALVDALGNRDNGPGQRNGCGCRTAGSGASGGLALLALGLGGFLARSRPRRRLR